ncbi:TonB-dependent receptor plug domain-containing protein [Pectinatus sottacetonis]|uniref:TonB-dependent receptor plug domain-containing protein n=1 Tax=Pectinatus sottacetonis TaxID=1002795 RepID=UPI0018C74059|nr:TonB-dependent receptor [Pectinatus sottacetonis]
MKQLYRKTAILSVVVTGSVLLGSAATVLAENSTQDFDLGNEVITAARTKNKLIDTAANVFVITAKDFADRNYQNVSEALDNVPGVIVKRSGVGGEDQHIYINGDSRVLIMVDGRPLNLSKGTEMGGRSGFDISNLPSPEFIKKIEIVKGAASSLYGSDAVGGVVNIITKSGSKNEITLNADAGSWGTRNYSASMGGKVKKTDYFITLAKSHQDYIKYKNAQTGHDEEWPNSANNTNSATVKLEQHIGTDQSAALYFSHFFKDGRDPYASPESGKVFKTGAWGTDLDNDAAFKYIWNEDKDNNGFAQVYRNYSFTNFASDTTRGNYGETRDGAEVQQNIRLNKADRLVTGIEWHKSKIKSSYYGQEHEINTKAVYLQNIWDINRLWNLTSGVRYNKHNYFGHKTTLHMAVNRKIADNGHAYFSWGQVFDAPQGNDMFYYLPNGYYGPVIGNPNLKPETGNVYTLGYDSKLDNKTNIGVSAFYNDLTNAIEWDYIDPANHAAGRTVYNIGRQKRNGIEIDFNHQFDDTWSADASYTYVRSREDKGTGDGFQKDLKLPPNQYKFGINYHKNRWNGSLFARGISGASREEYVASKWLVLDLAAQYKVNKNMKVYAKVYNLTNAAYAENAGLKGDYYEFPMPGRTFLAGISYNF